MNIGVKGRLLIVVLLVLVLFQLVFTFYWSREPDIFDVRKVAQQKAKEQGVEVVTGYTSVAVVTQLMEKLLNKPGGYLSNDVILPSVLLDDMPSWEFGAVVQIRDFARALRKDFSRSQTQSTEDDDVSNGEPKFFFDHSSWMLPSTETEYKEGLKYFYQYAKRLADPVRSDAEFFARADNLNNWLGDVSTRLGSLSRRLSASVARARFDIEMVGDISQLQLNSSTETQLIKTSWLDLDDVFYEARGSAWALINLLNATLVDFRPILEKKNAVASFEQIIKDLEATQDTIWSPMVLNGDGFGFLANHSLVMANYISRANAAILDLRELLSKG